MNKINEFVQYITNLSCSAKGYRGGSEIPVKLVNFSCIKLRLSQAGKKVFSTFSANFTTLIYEYEDSVLYTSKINE